MHSLCEGFHKTSKRIVNQEMSEESLLGKGGMIGKINVSKIEKFQNNNFPDQT